LHDSNHSTLVRIPRVIFYRLSFSRFPGWQSRHTLNLHCYLH